MLLSAPFPAGLSRVRGSLHQSLYLESSNHGNCAGLMYETNKKISRHQTVRKPVYDRPRHGKQTAELLKNLPETRNGIMNMLLQDNTLGLKTLQKMLWSLKHKRLKQIHEINQFSLLYSSEMDKSLWVRLSLASLYFSVFTFAYRETTRYTEHVVQCGDHCCVLLLRWSLLAWSWHYALHMGSVGTEAEARSKGQSLLQADL